MRPSEPVLSVVVITWRSRDLLAGALRAVVQTTRTTHELVVVDNGSADGTLELLATEFPDAVVIANPTNRGVAAARNQGLARARGRYKLLLDADTVAHDGALDGLVAFLDAHPSVGVAGAKLVYPDGTVQTSCRRFPTVLAPLLNRLTVVPGVRRSALYRRQHMLDLDRTQPVPVDYLLGACQMIRSDTLAAVGPLDERIFYGPEDADFCLRVWRAGWEVWYVPTVTIAHLYQRITRKLLSKITWRHALGLVYFYRKHRYAFRPPTGAPNH